MCAINDGMRIWSGCGVEKMWNGRCCLVERSLNVLKVLRTQKWVPRRFLYAPFGYRSALDQTFLCLLVAQFFCRILIVALVGLFFRSQWSCSPQRKYTDKKGIQVTKCAVTLIGKCTGSYNRRYSERDISREAHNERSSNDFRRRIETSQRSRGIGVQSN